MLYETFTLSLIVVPILVMHVQKSGCLDHSLLPTASHRLQRDALVPFWSLTDLQKHAGKATNIPVAVSTQVMAYQYPSDMGKVQYSLSPT